MRRKDFLTHKDEGLPEKDVKKIEQAELDKMKIEEATKLEARAEEMFRSTNARTSDMGRAMIDALYSDRMREAQDSFANYYNVNMRERNTDIRNTRHENYIRQLGLLENELAALRSRAMMERNPEESLFLQHRITLTQSQIRELQERIGELEDNI